MPRSYTDNSQTLDHLAFGKGLVPATPRVLRGAGGFKADDVSADHNAHRHTLAGADGRPGYPATPGSGFSRLDTPPSFPTE